MIMPDMGVDFLAEIEPEALRERVRVPVYQACSEVIATDPLLAPAAYLHRGVPGDRARPDRNDRRPHRGQPADPGAGRNGSPARRVPEAQGPLGVAT